jgi:hypothetical protein
LLHASSDFQYDKEIVLIAVSTSRFGYALNYAAGKLKGDKEVVITAVKKHGRSLKYAHELLKVDKEIVLLAVNNDGHALKYALGLYDDKEVVLAAVKNYGGNLEFASIKLCFDFEISVYAISNCADAYIHSGYGTGELDITDFWLKIEPYKIAHESKIIFLIGSKSYKTQVDILPVHIRRHIIEFIKEPLYMHILKAEENLRYALR